MFTNPEDIITGFVKNVLEKGSDTMGWKCAPQVMGLVRGEPKSGQKHRADIRKIALEAGYERASRSDTLDRRRSYLNKYEGYRSGTKFADDMEQEAASYRVQVKGKTKDGQDIIREKGLPHNAVIGWAVIYNPPAEVCADWTDEQYEKFHRDCRECMAEIEPRLFRQNNIRMSAEHFDEGLPVENGSAIDRHFHDLGISKDGDGHYCGNLIDSKLLIKINENFPAMMRKRGWNMDDLDTTDFELAKEDKKYALERNAMRRKSGLSVNKHLSQKAREALEEASEKSEQATEIVNQAIKQKQQIEADLSSQEAELQKTARELEETKRKLDRQDKTQRRFARLIKEMILELGGERPKIATYADAMDALIAAKGKFVESARADAEKRAQEEAEAKFQSMEEALEAQKSVLSELEDIRDKLQKSASIDTSRQHFMESKKNKDGRTLEEIYQASLREFDVRKKKFLLRADELTAEYYSLHENTNLHQREL